MTEACKNPITEPAQFCPARTLILPWTTWRRKRWPMTQFPEFVSQGHWESMYSLDFQCSGIRWRGLSTICSLCFKKMFLYFFGRICCYLWPSWTRRWEIISNFSSMSDIDQWQKMAIANKLIFFSLSSQVSHLQSLCIQAAAKGWQDDEHQAIPEHAVTAHGMSHLHGWYYLRLLLLEDSSALAEQADDQASTNIILLNMYFLSVYIFH